MTAGGYGGFEPQVPTVGSDDVAGLQAAGWTLVDVRTDEEWVTGRIAGSIHVPLHELVARLDEVPEQVVCVCAVGGRSAKAAQFLQAQGRDAANLEGGVKGWIAVGRPLES